MNEELEINFVSDFDKEFLEEFRKGIWMVTDERELISVVPDSRYHGYIDLLCYFRDYALEEMNDTLEMINASSSNDDIVYLKKDLEISNMRVRVFELLINEYNEKLRKEEEIESYVDKFEGERNLIYLKSKAGNVLVESDLEDITQESAIDMKNAFDFLRSGVFSADQTKYKTLSNLKGLKGVREVKDYQSRIYFYHLEYDIVIVFLALVKKGDNPRKERDKILNRRTMMDEYVKKIEMDLADPIKREVLLNEGREITERIDDLLSSKKMGGK